MHPHRLNKIFLSRNRHEMFPVVTLSVPPKNTYDPGSEVGVTVSLTGYEINLTAEESVQPGIIASQFNVLLGLSGIYAEYSLTISNYLPEDLVHPYT